MAKYVRERPGERHSYPTGLYNGQHCTQVCRSEHQIVSLEDHFVMRSTVLWFKNDLAIDPSDVFIEVSPNFTKANKSLVRF